MTSKLQHFRDDCLAQDGVAQSVLVRDMLLSLRPRATRAAMLCYNMRKVPIIPPAPLKALISGT